MLGTFAGRGSPSFAGSAAVKVSAGRARFLGDGRACLAEWSGAEASVVAAGRGRRSERLRECRRSCWQCRLTVRLAVLLRRRQRWSRRRDHGRRAGERASDERRRTAAEYCLGLQLIIRLAVDPAAVVAACTATLAADDNARRNPKFPSRVAN